MLCLLLTQYYCLSSEDFQLYMYIKGCMINWNETEIGMQRGIVFFGNASRTFVVKQKTCDLLPK